MMQKNSKIYIAGHTGLVGSAIKRELEKKGYENLSLRTSKKLDLRDQAATEEFFGEERPEYVFLAAAKVGGIRANIESPANFIYDNLQIQTNVIHSAWKSGVEKLVFLGSNCMYPKESRQPMKEEYLLTGSFEPTNRAYATAKIAGMEMCGAYGSQYEVNFVTVIPASQFGPKDDFNLESSHLVSALIRKFHEAKKRGDKKVTLWGSGKPRREIMYVDDLADALIIHKKN